MDVVNTGINSYSSSSWCYSAFLHHTLTSIHPNVSRYTRAGPRRSSDLMPVFFGVQALFFTTYFPKLISWSCGSLELQSYYTRSRGHAPEERTNRLSLLTRRRTWQGQGSRPGSQKLQSTLLGRRTSLLSAAEVFPACSSAAPSCSSLCLFPPPPLGGGGNAAPVLPTFIYLQHRLKGGVFQNIRSLTVSPTHFMSISPFFSQTFFFFFLLAVIFLRPFFSILLCSVFEETSYNRDAYLYNRDAYLIRPEEFSHGCRAAGGRRRTKKI